MIGRWPWGRFRALRIEIHRAKYLAHGLRMPTEDEGSARGGMLPARLLVSVGEGGSGGNVQLVASVRLGLHNRGPASRHSSI